MANGGGNWTTQNNTIPGFYANAVSRKFSNEALADRGICTVPYILPWGESGKMTSLTAEDFYKKSFDNFGTSYGDEKLRGLREIFKHARLCHVFNINGVGTDSGSKATIYEGSQPIATAKYFGSGGNKLSLTLEAVPVIPVETDDDETEETPVAATAGDEPGGEGGDGVTAPAEVGGDPESAETEGEGTEGEGEDTTTYTYKVTLYMDKTEVFTQEGVTSPNDLAACDYVDWVTDEAEPYSFTGESGSDPLVATGGADKETVTGDDFEVYLTACEGYSFNIMICPYKGSATARVFQEVQHQRGEVGKLYQAVVFNYDPATDKLPAQQVGPTVKNGYEGLINVVSYPEGSPNDTSLVYWVGGAEAGCPVNKDLTNDLYDGEIKIDLNRSQEALETLIGQGKFVFHNVDGEPRVLEDINTYTGNSEEKNTMFGSNQTIRVIDGIFTEEAAAFNKYYLGTVQNDETGRAALHNRFTSIKDKFVALRAIEPFSPGDMTVAEGDTNDSVVVTDEIEIVSCMKKLYMTAYLV